MSARNQQIRPPCALLLEGCRTPHYRNCCCCCFCCCVWATAAHFADVPVGGLIHALLQAPMSQEGYDVLGGYMSPVGDAYSKPELAPARHRCAHKTRTSNHPNQCARCGRPRRPPPAPLADWNGHSAARPRDAAAALQQLPGSPLGTWSNASRHAAVTRERGALSPPHSPSMGRWRTRLDFSF